MDAIWVTIRLHASLWASMSKYFNKVTRILGFGALLLYGLLVLFFSLDKISLIKKRKREASPLAESVAKFLVFLHFSFCLFGVIL